MATTNRKDLRCDSNNDLIIVNGDFDIELSDQQHIKDIMQSGPGHYKQTPTIGVFISKFLNGPLGLREKRMIREELAKDGYSNIKIDYDNGQIKIKI